MRAFEVVGGANRMCQIVRVHCRIAAEEIQHLTNLAPGSAVNSKIRTRLASNGYWSSHVSSKVCKIPFLKGHLLKYNNASVDGSDYSTNLPNFDQLPCWSGSCLIR